jgi:flagellin-like protein
MRDHHERRGVSEIVGVLLMLAIVVSLGTAVFALTSGGMASLRQNYAAAMSANGQAAVENFAVEQVTFTIGSPGVLATDGLATGCFGGPTQNAPCTATTTSGSAALTTTKSNDVVVVMLSAEDTGSVLRTVSGVAATGLTFLKRSGGTIPTSPFSDAEVWYAIASSPLSAASITVTMTGAVDDGSIVAFGVSGANTATPWDPNVSLPKAGTATAASIPSVSAVSTNNANDMVLGFTGVTTSSDPSFPTETAGAGYSLVTTKLNGNGVGGAEAAAEYKVVSSLQSSISVAFGTTTDALDNWVMVGDAIQAAPASTSGADVYVRNVGQVQTTLVSVYILDTTANSFVSQTTINTGVNAGTFVDIPRSTLAFTPTHGDAYQFTVTSSLGNSVIFNAKAN